MKRISILNSMMILTLVLMGGAASAQSNEAQLHQAIIDRGAEESKAKELEAKTIFERERQDRRHRQVQKEISDQKAQIENAKIRQEKALQELEVLKVDQSDMDTRLDALKEEKQKFQNESDQVIVDLDSQRREYSEKQQSLDQEIAELSQAKKRAEREIANKSIEVQSLKANVARLEANRAEIESKAAEMEADEMRVRTEWMQTKLEVADSYKARDEANNRLADAKKRRDQAVHDLQIAQGDLAKAARARNETMKKAEMDVTKYEKEIQAAHRARISAESEQIRLDAEVAKIREYSYRMKESRDQALEQADQSDNLVWKSTLNLETARAELAKHVSTQDKEGYDKIKDEARLRGMSAAADASELVKRAAASVAPSPRPSERSWVTKSSCEAYEKPDKSSKKVGFFGQGQKFSAFDAKSGWVKIQSAYGAIVYVDGKCGRYEN